MLKTILKLTFTLGLLYYLINEGSLDLRELGVLIDSPSGLVVLFVVWALGFVLLSAKRWQVLLRGISIELSYWKAVKLQLVGLFFNVAMPGAVGGDLVKGYYVIKESGKGKKINAMLSIVVDRLLGLSSMFMLAGFFLVLSFSSFSGMESGRELIYFVICGLGGFVIFLMLVLSPFRSVDRLIDRVLSFKVVGFSIFKKIVDALKLYKDCPRYLFGAVGLSLLVQAGNMIAMWYVAELVSVSAVEFAKIAIVFPIGAILSAVPVSPGGLGVGHLAYERLFSLVGVSGGANIFNVYILAMISFNLLGGISYISNKAEISSLTNEDS